MARDSAATRARILDAALDEFAARGFAGARIDRIADAAQANKRSIYVYFESKDGLFDAALEHGMVTKSAVVPFTPDDLPDYAGRLFDHWQQFPQALRMGMWQQLERPQAVSNNAPYYAEMLAGITAGKVPEASGVSANDLLVLIVGMSYAWALSPDDFLGADGRDPHAPERKAEHRAALVEAARRLCEPTG